METQIYLRPMTEEDADLIVEWRNRPELKRFFICQDDFTKEGHLQWFRQMKATQRACQMMICDKKTDMPLGSVDIKAIDWEHHKGEYGIFLGEEAARGRGIGTEAAKLMLAYGFEQLGLHRIYLRALATNEQAIRSYEKAGFVREGYLHDDVYICGRYVDIVLMAAVKKEKESEG